jgi:hypothetical protein
MSKRSHPKHPKAPPLSKPEQRSRTAPPRGTDGPLAPTAPIDVQPYTHEQIACLAYSLWERQGRPEGTDQHDWFEAERQLCELNSQQTPSRRITQVAL